MIVPKGSPDSVYWSFASEANLAEYLVTIDRRVSMLKNTSTKSTKVNALTKTYLKHFRLFLLVFLFSG